MNIRVLWIDDTYKIQGDVIGDAEQDGIDIISFESHEEGIEALEKDITRFHAVILDAKVKKNRNDNKLGLAGLSASRDRLIELNNQGFYLPYFIYTGDPDYMEKEWFIESYGEYYIKGVDNQRLFDDIKESVHKKEEYQIQREYDNVFRICKKLFDKETEIALIQILLGIKNRDIQESLYFIQLRKILAKLLRVAHNKGLLHDACQPNGNINLSESIRFMTGHQTKYLKVYSAKKHFPEIIENSVGEILSICGEDAHPENPESSKGKNLTEYRKQVFSPYLFYALTYKLLDVLIWFDNYLLENPDFEKNKSLWRENESNEGIIEKDENGNYFCGKHLLNKDYVNRNNKIGDAIIITEESENTNYSTKNIYPKYATKFHKKKN